MNERLLVANYDDKHAGAIVLAKWQYKEEKKKEFFF